jgi:hypothetical protein
MAFSLLSVKKSGLEKQSEVCSAAGPYRSASTSLLVLGAAMREPLLKHVHIIRLQRFLDMLYRPNEIAEELGVHPDTVYRSYLPAGLPHVRDKQGNIWIHGPEFVAWAKATITRKKKERAGLPPGQAWCMKCSAPVEIVSPRVRTLNRYLDLVQGRCPRCGHPVNRGQSHPHPSPLGEGQGVGSGGGS